MCRSDTVCFSIHHGKLAGQSQSPTQPPPVVKVIPVINSMLNLLLAKYMKYISNNGNYMLKANTAP